MDDNLSRSKRFGKNAFLLILFLASFNMPAIAQAKDSPVNRLQTQKAKRLTVEAMIAIKQGRWTIARQKIAQSHDPLAAKIFLWMESLERAEEDWTSKNFIQFSHFIRRNPDWPGIYRVKSRAEKIMPDDLSNAEVLAWFEDFPPQTPDGMERYMDTLIIEGKMDEARAFLAEWWASTLISREQQSRIFQKYGGYLTLDAHKKRFDALLYAGHYNNARGIAGVLGQGYPALAEARIALAQGRNTGLTRLINKVPSYLRDDPGLMYERLRWRRKRDLDSGALEMLMMEPDHERVQNPESWWLERHILIRRLLERGQYKKAYEIASKHMQTDGFSYAQAEWITGWLALRFMDDPIEAYQRFEALYHKVSTPVSKGRASYWAGRAAKAIGNAALARDWYQTAAEFQTVFYGQMAGAALAQENQLPRVKLPSLDAQDKRAFYKNELIQAFQIFRAVGMVDTSDQFLYAFLRQQETPKAYRFAAEMLAEEGDFHTAVKVAKKATRKGLFLTKQSYPTITKHLAGMDVAEWALIHAIIRQESMFDYEAESGAGALGLMQLMPATAREVSGKLNMSYRRAWLTERPKYNMMLGGAYIQRLIDKYDGSYPLAIVAYNAGPGRVDRWLDMFGDPRTGEVDLIDWIELIPIYETRNYVQRVLEGVYVYRLRLSGIQEQPKGDIHIANRYNP